MAAFVGITFSPASIIKGASASVLVDSAEVQSEYVIGVPGSSVATTITATDSTQVCRVVVSGTATDGVWITIGPAPAALPGTKFLVLTGTTEYFALNRGDKVAVFEQV